MKILMMSSKKGARGVLVEKEIRSSWQPPASAVEAYEAALKRAKEGGDKYRALLKTSSSSRKSEALAS